MADFNYELNDWAMGVVQAVENDKLAPQALSSALNTQFWKVGGGQAAIGTRPGLRLATQFIATSGTPAVEYRYMTNYYYPASDTVDHTPYIALVGGDGHLKYKEPDDSWDQTNLVPPAGYPSATTCIPTDYTGAIDSTVMNGRLFLIAGPIRRSLKGKTYKPFGLSAPQGVAETVATQAGVTTRLPADTYSIYISAYESSTGAESNPTYLGDFTTDGSDWSTDTQGDGLIRITLNTAGVISDKWRVYVQRLSTQAQTYLMTDAYLADDSIVANDGNISINNPIVVVNLSSAVLADLIIPMPFLTENSAMPADAIFIATYGRRMIAASRRKIYWSKLDIPEAFPPENFEIIDTGEGDEIVGLLPVSGEQMLIFTTSSVWVLQGINPQYWTLTALDTTIGCVSKASIVKFDNSVGWWSPQYGPVIWRGGEIEKIGLEMLGRKEEYSPFHNGAIFGGWDPYYEHIMWAVIGQGDTETTKILPYNYRMNAWVAEYWDPFKVSFFCTGETGSGEQRLFVMDNGSRLYYFDHNTPFDGLAGGTSEGTFVAGSGEISTITGSGFYSQAVGANTADLARQRVTIVDSTGQLVARRQIASNTSTVLTLDRTVLVTSGATYSYFISTPFVQISLPWMDGGAAFLRKRHDRLYVDVKSSSVSLPTYAWLYVNNNPVTPTVDLTITTDQVQTATTDATWDVPVWLTEPFVKKRLNLWSNGHNCMLKIQQHQPVKLMVSKLSILGRVLSDRYYS